MIYFMVLIASTFISAQSFATELPIRFQAGSKTPAEVQEFLTRLFNQKCERAVETAIESKTRPFTSYEDIYFPPGVPGRASAHYDVVYDRRYADEGEMVATFSLEYQRLPNGKSEVIAAQIIDAYDSSFCVFGTYRPGDLR